MTRTVTVDPLSNEDVLVQHGVSDHLYTFFLVLFWLIIIGAVILCWEGAKWAMHAMEPPL